MKAFSQLNKSYYNELELTSGQKIIYCEGGTFQVDIYGAGGGSYGWSYDKAWGTNGGGSGAGFSGIITIPDGRYQVSVGNFNGSSTQGGTSFLGNLISCQGGGYDTHGYGSNPRGWCQGYGSGGTLTIDEDIIVSYTIKSDGNNGACNSFDGGANRYQYDGGKSVYDNTSTGWGAGQYSGYSGSGVGGYFKITALTGKLYTPEYSISLFAVKSYTKGQYHGN